MPPAGRAAAAPPPGAVAGPQTGPAPHARAGTLGGGNGSAPCSVADPGCLSRILIFTHSGSRIPDTKTATKERGKKN
jgi:hypothetical protein